MIEVDRVTKRFGSFTALEDVSCTVADGDVLGLVGYNGAGKTTLLKIVAGVYAPDAGRVLLDGAPVDFKRASHSSLFIVADEPYFAPQATPETMRAFYKGYYPTWSDAVYERMLALFGLDPDARIAQFSKGMQRQLGILLGFSTGVRTLLLDESFDGLDLSKRNLLKRLLRLYARTYGAAVILSSHNLRELEDACDHLLMIKGCHVSFAGSVTEVHAAYPGSSLEEIFLSERAEKDGDIDAIFS